jgi:hypothetical protein
MQVRLAEYMLTVAEPDIGDEVERGRMCAGEAG